MRHFPILFALFWVLSSFPASAQEWLEKGDELARWGQLDKAREAYAKVEGAEGLYRRLNLALAKGDWAELRSVEKALSKDSEPQSALRLAYAKGSFSFRSRRHTEAAREFEKVRELSQGRTEPFALFARFAAESFFYQSRLATEGWPEAAILERDIQKIVGPLGKLPQQELFEPLLISNFHPWVELWLQLSIRRIHQRDHRQAKELKRLSVLVTFLQLAMGDRFVKLQDPEAGALAVQYPLDMAEGLAELDPVQARKWLNNAGFVLKVAQRRVRRKIIDEEQAKLGLQYFRARYLEVEAKILAAEGRIDQALVKLEQAINLLQNKNTELHKLTALLAYVQTSLARSSASSWDLTQSFVAEARQLSRALGLPKQEIEAELHLASLHQRLGSSESCLQASIAAIALLEKEAPYLSSSVEDLGLVERCYDRSISAHLKSGQEAVALQHQQRRDAVMRLLRQDLSRIESADPQLQKELELAAKSQQKVRDFQSQKQSTEALGESTEGLQKSIASNRADFLKALNNISRQNPAYANLVAIKPTSLARIQSQLPEGALLIQYCQTAEELLIFTARVDSLKITTVPISRADLEAEVFKARREVTGQGRQLSSLVNLYGHLIKPLELEIEKASLLLIAPTESLHHLPFAALAEKNGNSYQYLIQQKPLAFVTSTELLSGSASSSAGRLALVLGDPDGSLPSAREEAQEVAKLFPGSEVYLAEQATAQCLEAKKPDVSVIHLATHAITNPEDVNSSYLLVAGGDHKLTQGEIYGLDLKGVDLVTLSACETAVGEERPTWAVASLAQAFQLAGADTLVASLWNVGDRATRSLMLAFYNQLLSDKSKAEALRQAQMELLKDRRFSHPYFWSGFAVLGDWQ